MTPHERATALTPDDITAMLARADLATSEPDEGRECRRCHETMGAPDVGYEEAPLCNSCAHWVASELAEDVGWLTLALSAANELRATLTCERDEAKRQLIAANDDHIETLRKAVAREQKRGAEGEAT